MNVANLIRIALEALLRNRIRTLLSMLGIIIGVASVIAMLAIGQGSKESIRAQITDMGSNMIMVFPTSGARGAVRAEGAAVVTLGEGDLDALSQEASLVAFLSPSVNYRGRAISGAQNWPTQVYGVSPQYLEIRKQSVVVGRGLEETDVRRAAKVCVLGQTVVENLFGLDDLDAVEGKTVRLDRLLCRVVGVLARKGGNAMGQDQDDVILMPWTTVQKRLLSRTHFNMIYASAREEGDISAAALQITEVLQSRRPGRSEDTFQVRTQEEFLSAMSSTSELMTILLTAIAAISLLVGGIGIMNIMLVSVTERTREIGLRMAVGARGRDILVQFLLEAVAISLAGGVLGVFLGVGLSLWVGASLGWPILISPLAVISAFGTCFVTGVFFGWYPARKAAALDPMTALRYE